VHKAVIILALALASCDVVEQATRTECAGILLPPAEIASLPILRPIRILELPASRTREVCSVLSGERAAACTIFGDASDVIRLPLVDGETSFIRHACWMEHELGHARSRSTSHEGWA
jgi:hypothetical protein